MRDFIFSTTWSADRSVPVSAVSALPARSPRTFDVSWTGTDPTGSGLAGCDIYLARAGSGYALWRQAETNRVITFAAEPGINYRFYSVAYDQVGNRESSPVAPVSADAETITELWLLDIRGSGTNTTVEWESATGMAYRVFVTSNMLEDFAPLGESIPATPPVNRFADADATNAPPRFYRIFSTP